MKQRATGRTVACFTAMSLDKSPTKADDIPITPSTTLPATENQVIPTVPFERSENLARFFKLGSGPTTTKLHSGRIEKTPAKSPTRNVLTQSHINRLPAPVAENEVYSDRVGITTTRPMTTGIENLPYSYLQPPSLSARYTCTCKNPKSCPRCRLLALADRYVSQEPCILEALTDTILAAASVLS
jgi:hypothetical protein